MGQIEESVRADIIKAPGERERILEGIRQLREKISSLLLRRDQLIYEICPALQAKYDQFLGGLELELLNLRLQYQELKLTLEAMRARKNRQEKVDYQEAKASAEEKTSQFQDFVRKKREEQEQARRKEEEERKKQERWEWEQAQKEQKYREQEEAQDERSPEQKLLEEGIQDDQTSYVSFHDELRKLYRKIVKRLHPDSNPNVTEEGKRLFRKAVDAYHEEDLEKLREIAAILDSSGNGHEKIVQEPTESLEELRERYQTLKRKADALQTEILMIMSQVPYTYQAFLSDAAAVHEKREELQMTITIFHAECQRLSEEINQMRAA